MSRTDPEFPGLSSAEATARVASDGYNEIPSARRRNVWKIAWEVVREPMFLLLIGASAIYLVLGDLREALVLSASVLVVMGVTFFQERKTERALEALRELASPRTDVLRDGAWKSVPGRDLVPGDIARLKEGDRIPADALVLSTRNLMTDESLLTGESVPVTKCAAEGVPTPARPGGDNLPFVYSGTLVTQGQGVARVMATGLRTEVGKIGKALQALQPERSNLQRETGRAVVIFAAIGLTLCVLVTILYGIKRHDWLNGLLAGITLAMANLPEELPVVLTVFMALGAWRISQQRVLTRRAPAIESLGSTTVICVDKTGTLTENRMSVQALWVPGTEVAAPAEIGEAGGELIAYSVLASEREPFDPMEKAYHRMAREQTSAVLGKIDAWSLKRTYPLAPTQLSVANVWQPPGSAEYIVAAKGAPEAIVALCQLDATQHARISAETANMAQEGLRVLAVAGLAFSASSGGVDVLPESQGELRLRFIGLTGLADPVRPAVPAALRECYAAGIRTVMITGDYPGTAVAIARSIGLSQPDAVITGAELDQLSDSQLSERAARVNVFARVMPEHKLRLVQTLKANGEVVTMTGDGVNDAPALKAAHIGVAMGRRGSDVAREAASLVLLDDDFTSMVAAVRLGRRIFDNIQNAAGYIIAVHVPVAGLALLPLVMDWPLILFPVHIVFLEFVVDPACSIAFEADPPESNIMRRPPRPATAPLFNSAFIVRRLLLGSSVLVTTALLYGWVLAGETPEPQARAMAFAGIVIGNIALILSNRSAHATLLETLRRPNRALWWVIGGALLGLALALFVPPAQEIFRFAPITADQLLLSAGAAVIGPALLEIYKWLRPTTAPPESAQRRQVR